MEARSRLYIGTSGWSYKHWEGIFYPKEVKLAKYLEYYTTKFNCVELNSSFYHLPQKKTVSGWVQRTPDAFKFCPKLSRYITHQKKLIDIEEPLQKFFDLFEEMKKKLGPVLIQLPPGLEFDPSLIEEFLELLKKRYHSHRFAIEVRNRTWITDHFFNLLEKYGIAFVIADSGTRFPYHETVTTDFVYLRFHGHESLYASNYSEADLAGYAQKIKHWLEQGNKVWGFFNNDFHGFAVKNAERLRNLIESN